MESWTRRSSQVMSSSWSWKTAGSMRPLQTTCYVKPRAVPLERPWTGAMWGSWLEFLDGFQGVPKTRSGYCNVFKNLRSYFKGLVMHHCQVISLKTFFESIFPVAPLRKLSHAHAVAEETNWEGPGNQQAETMKTYIIGAFLDQDWISWRENWQRTWRFNHFWDIGMVIFPSLVGFASNLEGMTCIRSVRWVASRCGTKAMPMSSSSHRCSWGCARRRTSQKP